MPIWDGQRAACKTLPSMYSFREQPTRCSLAPFNCTTIVYENKKGTGKLRTGLLYCTLIRLHIFLEKFPTFDMTGIVGLNEHALSYTVKKASPVT